MLTPKVSAPNSAVAAIHGPPQVERVAQMPDNGLKLQLFNGFGKHWMSVVGTGFTVCTGNNHGWYENRFCTRKQIKLYTACNLVLDSKALLVHTVKGQCCRL